MYPHQRRANKSITVEDLAGKPLEVVCYLRYRGCERKQAYDTKKEAQTVKNAIARRHKGRRNAKELNVYPCPFCEKWHVGNRAKAKDNPKHVKTEKVKRKQFKLEKEEMAYIESNGYQDNVAILDIPQYANSAVYEMQVTAPDPQEQSRADKKIARLTHDVTFWQGKFHAVKHENNVLRKKAEAAEKLLDAITEAMTARGL